jgi:hypothetical protein
MESETNKCNCSFSTNQGVKRDAHAEDEASINARRHGSKRESVAYAKLKQIQSNGKLG